MKFTPELLTKAKEAKSAEELLALAKENDIELTAEEAEQYFGTLHPADGELFDDELDNVSGGGCGDDSKVDDYTYYAEDWVCYKNSDGVKKKGKIVLKTYISSEKTYMYRIRAASSGEEFNQRIYDDVKLNQIIERTDRYVDGIELCW